jgi:hypothetical protein
LRSRVSGQSGRIFFGTALPKFIQFFTSSISLLIRGSNKSKNQKKKPTQLSIIHHPHLQLPLFPLDWMKLEDFGLKDEVGECGS